MSIDVQKTNIARKSIPIVTITAVAPMISIPGVFSSVTPFKCPVNALETVTPRW